MSSEASTGPNRAAQPTRQKFFGSFFQKITAFFLTFRGGSPRPDMSRFFIIIFALFLALLVGAFLVIGAFPPHVHRAPVEHVLPNDKFPSH